MNAERVKILGSYGLTALAGLLTCVPSYMAQNVGMAVILLSLIAAYIFRAGTADDSFIRHHMTFIIRTIWVYSGLAVIGMIGASYQIMQQGDSSAINNLMDMATNGSIPTEDDMRAATQTYLDSNSGIIFKSIILWSLPALIYLGWRLARGSARAYRNYRVANLQSWF